jgi:hypothetical protein
MVAAAGAGPSPIPYRKLNVENLADALRVCLSNDARIAAQSIADRMRSESGVRRAVASFHANLPLTTMRCDILPSQPAVWLLKKGNNMIKLSKEAAGILVAQSHITWKDVKRLDFRL